MDSAYDKARKPYVPIDTCSPAGTWVEEKRYNRSRPTGANARKVLCGNWQEEQVLENDLLAQESEEQALGATAGDDTTGGVAAVGTAADGGAATLTSSSIAAGTMRGGSFGGATLDVIKDKGNGHYAGGFLSTPYLTCDPAHPTLRSLQTTQRADYNHTNGDVTALRRTPLGIRSQHLLQQALDTAAKEKAEEETQRTQRATASATQSRGLGGFSVDLGEADGDDDRHHSLYKATMCRGEPPLPVVESLVLDYLTDEPITIYTGNPSSQETMAMHGKTPVDPMSTSRFGKHTYFSDKKYNL